MVASYSYASPYQQYDPNMNSYGYFSNQTVWDKVPADMIHLVDPYWKVSNFKKCFLIYF